MTKKLTIILFLILIGCLFVVGSVFAKTITTNGDTQVDTAIKKFGTGSGLFDGTGDFLTLSLGEDIFGTEDFTIDFWVYITDFHNYESFVSTRSGPNDETTFSIGTNADSDLLLYSNVAERINVDKALSSDTWQHIAMVRASGEIVLYLDGVEIGDVALAYDFTEQDFHIGSTNGAGEYFTGHLDELRLSKGVARWTANFTPRTSVYTCADDYTTLLIHFDGEDATTDFYDDETACGADEDVIFSMALMYGFGTFIFLSTLSFFVGTRKKSI